MQLKTHKQLISTKQFEIIYSLSPKQKKEQRGKVHGPLPYTKLGDNKNVLYDREIVDKWFENYTRE